MRERKQPGRHDKPSQTPLPCWPGAAARLQCHSSPASVQTNSQSCTAFLHMISTLARVMVQMTMLVVDMMMMMVMMKVMMMMMMMVIMMVMMIMIMIMIMTMTMTMKMKMKMKMKIFFFTRRKGILALRLLGRRLTPVSEDTARLAPVPRPAGP